MKFSTVLGFAAIASASPQWGCKPGTYSCTPNHKGWQVCSTARQWVVSSSPTLPNKTMLTTAHLVRRSLRPRPGLPVLQPQQEPLLRQLERSLAPCLNPAHFALHDDSKDGSGVGVRAGAGVSRGKGAGFSFFFQGLDDDDDVFSSTHDFLLIGYLGIL
jgi:hypothetical protein